MKQFWELNPQSFEKMLDWLDKDREIAGQKYEAIRLRLIKVLHYRGCFDGESLADEAIDRVTQKIDLLAETYEGDPAYYFLNVANKIYLEHRRKPVSVELPTNLAELPETAYAGEENFQPEYECLKKCLANLSDSKRGFILDYYQENKKEKIAGLQQIADREGIELTSLHMRAFRLRESLQKCVLKCLAETV
jgi:DNA-directed RNA polymerase specialized sigma24 family protein